MQKRTYNTTHSKCQISSKTMNIYPGRIYIIVILLSNEEIVGENNYHGKISLDPSTSLMMFPNSRSKNGTVSTPESNSFNFWWAKYGLSQTQYLVIPEHNSYSYTRRNVWQFNAQLITNFK